MINSVFFALAFCFIFLFIGESSCFEFIIVQESQLSCALVGPENPDLQEEFAISELLYFFEEFTGFELKRSSDSGPLPAGNIILVGRPYNNRHILRLIENGDISGIDTLNEEGFIISIIGHRNILLVTANNSKGIIYGVYALIEKIIEKITGLSPVDIDFHVKGIFSLSLDFPDIKSQPFYPLRCALSQEDPKWLSRHRINISAGEGVWTGTGIDDGLGTAFKYVTDPQFEDVQDESFSRRLSQITTLNSRFKELKSKGIDTYLFMYIMGEPTKAMMENRPELLENEVEYVSSRNGKFYKPISWTKPAARVLIKELVRSIVKTYSPWLTGFHLRSWGAETRAPAGRDEEQQKLLWDIYLDIISAAREIDPNFKFLISGYDEYWLKDPKREYASKLPSGTIFMNKWGIDGEPTRDPLISTEYLNKMGSLGHSVLVLSHDVEEVMPLWMLESDMFVEGVRKYANTKNLKGLGGFTLQGDIGFSHLDKLVSARMGWNPFEDYVLLMQNYLTTYYGDKAAKYILNALRINSRTMADYFSDFAGSLSLTGKYGQGSRGYATRLWNILGPTAVKDTLAMPGPELVDYAKKRFNSLLPSQQEAVSQINIAKNLVYAVDSEAWINYNDALHLMRFWVRFFESRLKLIETLELGLNGEGKDIIEQKFHSAIEYSREMQSEIREINRFVSVFNHDNQSARLSLLDTIDREIQFLEEFDLTTITNSNVKESVKDELSIKNLIFHPGPKRDRGTFSYILTSRADKATILIYNLRGKKIRTITDASSRSGYNEYTWLNDDDNYVKLANGVYIYKIIVEKDQKKIQAIGKLAIIR